MCKSYYGPGLMTYAIQIAKFSSHNSPKYVDTIIIPIFLDEEMKNQRSQSVSKFIELGGGAEK